MRLTKEKKDRIAHKMAEVALEATLEQRLKECDPPAPFPGTGTIVDMIEASEPYRMTTRRDILKCTNEIEVVFKNAPGVANNWPKTIRVFKPLPIIQDGHIIDLVDGLSLQGPSYRTEGELNLQATPGTKYRVETPSTVVGWNNETKQYWLKILSDVNTLNQMRERHPEIEKTIPNYMNPIISEWEAKKEYSKKQAAERRQLQKATGKSVERLEVNAAVLSQARLLGAQYVSSD
jgi:hypothetical protein